MSAHRQQSHVLIALIAFHAVILISPLVYLAGFRTSFVVPGTIAVLLLVLAINARRIPAWIVILILISLVTSSFAGIYWESIRAALLPVYFCASLLAVAMASKAELRSVVQISGGVVMLFLVGGWIAVMLAASGVPPLGIVSGLHERVLYFYATTLTPTLIGDFIRPSGIYDEPGALSFVVCVVAYLRHVMGLDSRFTWVLLILGFVTFSLAHLVYVVIHLAAERRIWLAWTNLAIAFLAAIWALSSLGVWETFDARLVGRLSASSDSEKVVAGDNRTGNLLNAGERLMKGDPEVLLLGLDATCIEGSPLCEQKHPGFSFNPLTPLIHSGLLISWPYYLFLGVTVCLGAVRRSWWPLCGVALLFMQRPNLFSAGYAMLAALTLAAVWNWYGARSIELSVSVATKSKEPTRQPLLKFESRTTE